MDVITPRVHREIGTVSSQAPGVTSVKIGVLFNSTQYQEFFGGEEVVQWLCSFFEVLV